MTRIDVLRSQAHVLWRLAESFDITELRHDLRAIAATCEEMADQLLSEQEEQPSERPARETV
jgi:hypothetical protein